LDQVVLEVEVEDFGGDGLSEVDGVFARGEWVGGVQGDADVGSQIAEVEEFGGAEVLVVFDGRVEAVVGEVPCDLFEDLADVGDAVGPWCGGVGAVAAEEGGQVHSDGFGFQELGDLDGAEPVVGPEGAGEDGPPVVVFKSVVELAEGVVGEGVEVGGVELDALDLEGLGEGDVLLDGPGVGVGARGVVAVDAEGVGEAVGVQADGEHGRLIGGARGFG
jgi:hypothetical protein